MECTLCGWKVEANFYGRGLEERVFQLEQLILHLMEHLLRGEEV